MGTFISKKSKTSVILLATIIFITFSSIQAANIERIERQVKENINIVKDNNNKIDVVVENDGTVILKGNVETLYSKMVKHNAASKVSGVSYIINQIKVETPQTPAKFIEYNIERDLWYNSKEKPSDISIEVNDDGIVFLNGKVKSEKGRITAESVAAWQKGVKAVINNIEVSP